tara:strand:- start:302 stop:448 length:147 start_codon:yes stop_codon:yes gene_type:complete
MAIRLHNHTLTQKKGITQTDNPFLFLNTTLAITHVLISHTSNESIAVN